MARRRTLLLAAGILLVALALGLGFCQGRGAQRHSRNGEIAAERELLRGGLQGLLRARAMAERGAAADAEAKATLALANSLLASEYGLDTAGAALAVAQAVEATSKPSRRVQSLSLTSQALVELVAGHLEQAEALARRAVSLGQLATPQFALGRVRFRQGDLAGASHAFQAALLREPDFAEAKVAWAELWLEQGEWARARDSLATVLLHTRDHGRTSLLLAELGQVAGDRLGHAPDWQSTCQRDEAESPFTATACELARADQAWRSNDEKLALTLAKAAVARRPADPRLLGIAAQFLASVGAVDLASSCLDEATRMASPMLPSLRWARLAIDLGRGMLPSLPHGLAESSPWAPFLLARMALASGGIQGLLAVLPGLRNGRPEIEQLAALASAPDGPAPSGVLPPVPAYIRGLQARLAGNTTLAVALLGQALHGHGDACRAAGEYMALRRPLGQPVEADAFAELRAENSGCVNLPAAPVPNPEQTPARPRRAR